MLGTPCKGSKIYEINTADLDEEHRMQNQRHPDVGMSRAPLISSGVDNPVLVAAVRADVVDGANKRAPAKTVRLHILHLRPCALFHIHVFPLTTVSLLSLHNELYTTV